MHTQATHPSAAPDNGRQALYISLAAAAVIGLVMSPVGDQGFFAIILMGPLLTGFASRPLGISWRIAAVPWGLSGIFFFVYDGLVNNEDMGAHAVMTVIMVALVAIGALVAGPFVRRR